jgi:hypothetical protein
MKEMSDLLSRMEELALIKKSVIDGKYYSSCAMNEELTIELQELKKEFDRTHKR